MNVYTWDKSGIKVEGEDVFVSGPVESVVRDLVIKANMDQYGFRKINAIRDLRVLLNAWHDEDGIYPTLYLKEAKYIIEAIYEGPLKPKVVLDEWTIIHGPVYHQNSIIPTVDKIAAEYSIMVGRCRFKAERSPRDAYNVWENMTDRQYRSLVVGDILHNLTTDEYYLVKPIGFDHITITTRPYTGPTDPFEEA